MNFNLLLNSITHTHDHLQDVAAKAVNRLLTIRNWMIGYYIVEYEQKGEDRGKYGERLLENIVEALPELKLSATNLRLYRQFYRYYPQIGQSVTDELKLNNIKIFQIHQTVSDELQVIDSHSFEIGQTVSDQSATDLRVPSEKLLNRLSFSHIALLLTIPEPLKRVFYELETIKSNWSVRELKRQINTLYFERMGLANDKEKLQRLVHEAARPMQPSDIIKNVYTFEFLGLPDKMLPSESGLEKGLLDNLQDFLLEMGRGFCFESRQKRILIGDEYFFIDLVFYHRLLKCHVLVELKVGEYKHVGVVELNTYLNYWKDVMMSPDDNPPVGILLVTNKSEALVQYATAGMDQSLFISRYAVKLPSQEALEFFIRNELKNRPDSVPAE